MPGTSDTSKPGAAARRFVKALLRARRVDLSHGMAEPGGAAGAGLPEPDVRRLAAEGLVRIKGGTCYPTPESAAWLRRQMSAVDGFADQHRELVPGPDATIRDLGSSPLEKLARGTDAFLEDYHLAAGQKVCQWGAKAQVRQRITMSYDPAQVGGRRHGADATDITDMAADARKALARLYRDLPRDCAETVLDVCVFEKGLQTIEAERGWPRRSAKLVLRIGLDRLAAQLGLSPQASGRSSGRLTAWLDAGYQPTRFE